MKLQYYNNHFEKLNDRKRKIVNNVKERKYKQLKYRCENDMTEAIAYNIFYNYIQDKRVIKRKPKHKKYDELKEMQIDKNLGCNRFKGEG